jgi:hypothetical protein
MDVNSLIHSNISFFIGTFQVWEQLVLTMKAKDLPARELLFQPQQRSDGFGVNDLA